MNRIISTITVLTLATLFLISPIFAGTAKALFCEKTYPRIATIENIEINQDSSIDLNLKWVYSFTETISSSIIEIDNYSLIANNYIADELDQLTLLEEQGIDWKFDQLHIGSDFSTKMDINVSDIIITAPPIHVCSDSFLAVFSEEGRLKHVLLRGDFDDYSFAGESIITEIGKEIECEGYSCQVKTDFLINGKKSTLVPSQELEIKNSVFNKIFLRTSKASEEGIDSSSIFPWGGGRQLEYLIDFNPVPGEETPLGEPDKDSEIQEGDEEPMREKEPLNEHNDVEADLPEQPKKANIFKRFFSWLGSLFSR